MIEVPCQTQAVPRIALPSAAPDGEAASGAQATDPRTMIAALLASRGMHIMPPGPHDLVVLLRGLPVAP